MSWRESSGRESCNRCRKAVDIGAPLYVGEHTPCFWCEACAADVFGVTTAGLGPALHAVDGMGGLDKRAIAKAFPEFTEAMRALKARAAMKSKRVVVIGGEE